MITITNELTMMVMVSILEVITVNIYAIWRKVVMNTKMSRQQKIIDVGLKTSCALSDRLCRLK